MSLGFEVTSEDIAAILSRHSLHVTNTGGVSFPAMAEELLAAGYIDEDLVEKVALAASDDEDDDTSQTWRTRWTRNWSLRTAPCSGGSQSVPWFQQKLLLLQ